MRRLVALLVALGGAAAAQAAPPLSHDDTAACIAVMQHQADLWAAQLRQGHAANDAALRLELERAAALMGRTYLEGANDEAAAKARLKAAQDAQAGWTDGQRQTLRQACGQQADAERAAANALQRLVIERMAASRYRRMTSPRSDAAGAAASASSR